VIKKPKRKKYKIHVWENNEETYKNVFGVPITSELCPDIEFFFHKHNGFPRVSEKETGNQVVNYARGYDDACDRLHKLIVRHGASEFRRLIKMWKEKRDAIV
jgi:hypothetical protein